MSLESKKRAVMKELQGMADPQDRTAYLVLLGKRLAPLRVDEKVDEHLVKGCLSKLWFVAEMNNGKCYFRVDSDSRVVKGIAGLLCEIYSGSTPEEIIHVDPGFLGEVGITQHLTPNRRNGLSRLWDKIRVFAEENMGQPSGQAAVTLDTVEN